MISAGQRNARTGTKCPSPFSCCARTGRTGSKYSSPFSCCGYSNSTRPCLLGAVDKIAERKIARWLQEGGDKELPAGKRLSTDRHQHLSRSLGVYDDYIHSKILSDNNILPKSLELRLQLDKQWDILKRDIQAAYNQTSLSSSFSSQQPLSIEMFCKQSVCEPFHARMEALNKLAQRVNAAIIEDSMRFHGQRSPVRHAKPYFWDERVREALQPLLSTQPSPDGSS